MRIALTASGTHGDVQPMIALGKALSEAGHKVRLIAGSNFTTWIEGHGTIWRRRVYDLGIGARPIPDACSIVATLARRLDSLLNDTPIGTNAAALGPSMRAERGVNNAVDWISDSSRGTKLRSLP